MRKPKRHLYLRVEVGGIYLQFGRMVPDDDSDHPGPPTDHPAPQVIYHPERVGFYRLPDEGD